MTKPKKRSLPPPAGSTPERILAAAIRLFATDGFNGTTTRRIAQAAKVNEALIFRHFPTKQDLYRAIIQMRIEERVSRDLLESAAAPVGTDREILLGVARSLVASVERDPTFLRLFFFSALEGHELSSMFYDVFVTRLTKLVTSLIRRASKEGRFRGVNASTAARAFMNIFCHQVLIQALFPRQTGTRVTPKMMSDLIDIFLEGMSSRARR